MHDRLGATGHVDVGAARLEHGRVPGGPEDRDAGGADGVGHPGDERRLRSDDDEVTIRRRLEVYHRETKPLVLYFWERGLLRDIDEYRATLEEEGRLPVSDTALAGRWLTEVFNDWPEGARPPLPRPPG